MEHIYSKKRGGVYGGLYAEHAATMAIPLHEDAPEQIPFSGFMECNGVTYAPMNCIAVKGGGIYEVEFFLRLEGCPVGDRAGIFTVAVRRNGEAMEGMRASTPMALGGERTLGGKILQALSAGDTLDVAIRSTVEGSAFLPAGTSGMLMVKKVN